MSHATVSLVSRLSDFVAPGSLLADPVSLAAYEVDGLRPLAALLPSSAIQIAEILRFASAERLTAIPVGGKTHLHIGMPPHRHDLAIDLSAMNRVLAYEPSDLTLAVEPGIRFSQLDAHLRERRQFLPLSTAFPERGTMGGIVASANDGPLRYGYGTIRDFLLGLEFVTGDGVISKSGGSVVKNVTGYELHKLFIGSLGTLGVITRLNFRTFPLPSARKMYVASFAGESDAFAFCRAIVTSPLQPRILDVIDSGAATLFADRAGFLDRNGWLVIVEAAGQLPVLSRHAHDLASMSRNSQAQEFLSLEDSQRDQLFALLCEFSGVAFEASARTTIFRVAALPSALTPLLQQTHQLAARHELKCATLTRALSVVYIALLPENNASADPKLLSCSRELLDLCARSDAVAMIERCPLELKRALGVWPAPGNERALAKKLKSVFDPQNILSPGRFRGGI